MTHTTAKTVQKLSETIAIRLTLEETRAICAIVRREDRTISYIVRNLIRTFLQSQQQEATR